MSRKGIIVWIRQGRGRVIICRKEIRSASPNKLWFTVLRLGLI